MNANQPAEPILPLTSIRFLAAFYVVLHHSYPCRLQLGESTFFGRFLSSGHIAVGFFFTLSGFILALVYLNTERPFAAKKFWLARIARIYPLLILSLLLSVPPYLKVQYLTVPRTALRGTAIAFVGASSLLQAWFARFRDLNAPAWSLSAEAFFYLVFPVFAFWIWRRRGSRALALILLFWGLALATPLLVVHFRPELFYQQVETPGARLQYFIQLAPVLRIFEFFSGISLCAIHCDLATRYAAAQRSRWAYACLLISGSTFFTVIAFADRIPVMVLNNGILLPAFLLLIYALANAKGPLATISSNRWLVVLGESSYALYLLHVPILPYIDRFFPIVFLRNWLLYIAVLLAASLFSFFLIERPARRAILAFAAQRPRVLLEHEAAAPN